MSLFDVTSAPFNAGGVGGPVIVWKDAFKSAEIDSIVAYGDGLAPMKAEIAGRKENTDHLRITRVAWMERKPGIEWLHARLEEMVLRINAEFYRYDLYGLKEALSVLRCLICGDDLQVVLIRFRNGIVEFNGCGYAIRNQTCTWHFVQSTVVLIYHLECDVEVVSHVYLSSSQSSDGRYPSILGV